MPQLLLFVPCHKPVIDLEDNMLSIEDVLESISIDVPAGHEPPPGALAPFSWFAVALWYRLPADEGRQFEQRVELRDPQGESFVSGVTALALEGVRTLRARTKVNGFPVAQQGEHTLRLSYRAVGAAGWEEVASYPIRVEHRRVEAPPPDEELPARPARTRRAPRATQAPNPPGG